MNSKIVFFSQDNLGLLRQRVFELLEHRGVKIDHDGMRNLLADAGAKVDADTQRVCFPK